MNRSTQKFLKSIITPFPKPVVMDELIEIYGEDALLEGNVNLYEAVKKLWNSKSHKEKGIWKQRLA